MSFLTSLASQAKANPKRILFPEVMDARVVEATIILANESLAKPILVGSKTSLENTLKEGNLTLPSSVEVVDSTDAKEIERHAQAYFELRKHKGITIEEARFKLTNPVYFAMMLLREGRGDGLISGAHSSATKPLTPAFQIIGTREGVTKASSFFIMLKQRSAISEQRSEKNKKQKGMSSTPIGDEYAPLSPSHNIEEIREKDARISEGISTVQANKGGLPPEASAKGGRGDLNTAPDPLFFADCAINIEPSSEELAEIAILTADSAKHLGIEPRVALLSFSTYGSAKHPLADKVRIAREMVNKQRPDIVCAGEIQFDAALIPDIAQKKIPVGAGLKPALATFMQQGANVFIFPDLQSGNIAYKIIERLAGFSAIGPILQGLNKPVNDLSRGCSVEDVVNAALFT